MVLIGTPVLEVQYRIAYSWFLFTYTLRHRAHPRSKGIFIKDNLRGFHKMEQVEIYIERLHKPQNRFRSDNETNKARILMLHGTITFLYSMTWPKSITGHGQSGWFFYHKTKFLIKTLQMMASERNKKRLANGIELFYPNGPLQASQNVDPDVWAWGRGDFEGGLIDGLNETLKKIMDILHTYGPFVGVIGFSTGAAIAAITASLLEHGGDHALNTQVNSRS
jgi:hypothetical protein